MTNCPMAPQCPGVVTEQDSRCPVCGCDLHGDIARYRSERTAMDDPGQQELYARELKEKEEHDAAS